jgi:hypothetical protein
VTFDDLVTRLMALYDVTQARAVDVANERLNRMVAEAKSLRAIKSLGTTVADTASYALDATVVQVFKVKVAYTAGQINYEGTETIEDLWDLDAGTAEVSPSSDDAYWFTIEADSDSLQTTDNLRLYPAPDESGKTITGLVALRPATITYGSSTALPIPLNTHEHLLAGCKAELSDEEARQDESAKFEAVYQAGIARLKNEAESRGKGSGRHRMRVAGYDIAR